MPIWEGATVAETQEGQHQPCGWEGDALAGIQFPHGILFLLTLLLPSMTLSSCHQ